MPLYDYKCCKCGKSFEKFFPLKEYDAIPSCPVCNADGEKIITSYILRDEPVWLDDSVRNSLQDLDAGERPIQNRTEYNKYLKDNNIIPHS